MSEIPAANSLLIVDDDVFNREGVRLYLAGAGYTVLEAGDETTAWQLAVEHSPQAAVVDISIPPDPHTASRPDHNGGVRLAARLKQTYPAMGVILFSAYEDRGREIIALIQSGLRGIGYKLKGCQPSALLHAVQAVTAGQVVIDPEVQFDRPGLADTLLAQLTADEQRWVKYVLDNFHELTAREQDVVQRLSASHNTEGIAQALNVTPKTAENYIGHVYDKLGLAEMSRAAPHLRKVVILAKACLIRDLKP